MARVGTFNLTIWMKDCDITYRGISRVAARRYIAVYRENEKFVTYTMEKR